MRGFTLVELLVSIVILGLLSTIAYFSVSSSIEDSKQKANKIQEESIISAAKLWAMQNDNKILNEIKLNEKYELSVNDLIKSGLLKEETTLRGCVSVTCLTNCNQYNYVYGECNNVTN